MSKRIKIESSIYATGTSQCGSRSLLSCEGASSHSVRSVTAPSEPSTTIQSQSQRYFLLAAVDIKKSELGEHHLDFSIYSLYEEAEGSLTRVLKLRLQTLHQAVQAEDKSELALALQAVLSKENNQLQEYLKIIEQLSNHSSSDPAALTYRQIFFDWAIFEISLESSRAIFTSFQQHNPPWLSVTYLVNQGFELHQMSVGKEESKFGSEYGIFLRQSLLELANMPTLAPYDFRCYVLDEDDMLRYPASPVRTVHTVYRLGESLTSEEDHRLMMQLQTQEVTRLMNEASKLFTQEDIFHSKGTSSWIPAYFHKKELKPNEDLGAPVNLSFQLVKPVKLDEIDSSSVQPVIRSLKRKERACVENKHQENRVKEKKGKI